MEEGWECFLGPIRAGIEGAGRHRDVNIELIQIRHTPDDHVSKPIFGNPQPVHSCRTSITIVGDIYREKKKHVYMRYPSSATPL